MVVVVVADGRQSIENYVLFAYMDKHLVEMMQQCSFGQLCEHQ